MIDLTKDLRLAKWEGKLISVALEKEIDLQEGVFADELLEKLKKAKNLLAPLPCSWKKLITQLSFREE